MLRFPLQRVVTQMDCGANESDTADKPNEAIVANKPNEAADAEADAMMWPMRPMWHIDEAYEAEAKANKADAIDEADNADKAEAN